ncbi:hypothetical protein [Flavobacterium gelatinilyticum]|uniref:hypothetical protein n=1 Tax=Flavobacterium gelatinilyticum TaxID=3003260 RepID=UPI00247FC721|nr:hypothetical protein [Flavobacterium gelatinilyticum]
MKITTIKLLVLSIVFGAVSCSSNDTNEEENTNVSEQELYDSYVDAAMQKSINELGITIHKGNKPPTVEGVYAIEPFFCENSNFTDPAKGSNFGASTLTLSNQNTARLSIDLKNLLVYLNGNRNETWEGLGSFISGEGNKFSIFLHSNGEIDYGTYIAKYQNLIILSGELDVQDNSIKGIKNLQMASIMHDDYKDPNNSLIEIGQGRLFTNTYAGIK